MSALALDAAWHERLRQRLDQPPLAPRVPLLWRGQRIGSVETGFFSRVPGTPVREHGASAGWEVTGPDLSASLHSIALAMRGAGLAHVWRDEQLPVRGEDGSLLGTAERAVVRPLGIATFAVHLAGMSADGRHWVQQRSLDKANDPGMWDTLTGGMVPASDSLEQALARETWEEAGLRVEQLQGLAWGGRIPTRRPTGDVRGGYVVEQIDWFRCVVPEGVAPANQDGEVQQFALLAPAELSDMLSRDLFTLEAAAVLSECARNSGPFGP